MLWYHATLYRRCNTLGHVWLRLWGWKKAIEITWCENHPRFSVCRCGIPWPRHCIFSKAVWTAKVRKSMPPLSYRGGFTSIESGIGVAEFTSLDRDLPRKVVTQGLKIFCKYTGQLITCYCYVIVDARPIFWGCFSRSFRWAKRPPLSPVKSGNAEAKKVTAAVKNRDKN